MGAWTRTRHRFKCCGACQWSILHCHLAIVCLLDATPSNYLRCCAAQTSACLGVSMFSWIRCIAVFHKFRIWRRTSWNRCRWGSRIRKLAWTMLRVMGLATNVLGLAAFVLWLVYLVSVGAALAITTAAALLLAMSLMAAAAAKAGAILRWREIDIRTTLVQCTSCTGSWPERKSCSAGHFCTIYNATCSFFVVNDFVGFAWFCKE